MTMKSIVSAGLMLALVASSAVAQPSLTVDLVRNGSGNPVLDASGNYQWAVTITPDAAGGPIGAEIALNNGGTPVLSATTDAATFDRDNPGAIPGGLNALLSAAVLVDQAANNALPADAFNAPDGIVSAADGVYAALGSIDLASASDVTLLNITTDGPATTTGLTTSLTSLGAFSGLNGAGGTITGGAQYNVAQNGTNNLFAGSTVSYTAFTGDVNLDGTTNNTDITALFPFFNQAAPGGWSNGDINGDGFTNNTDITALFPFFNQSAPGAASASVVPEPTAGLLALLAAASATFARRQR